MDKFSLDFSNIGVLFFIVLVLSIFYKKSDLFSFDNYTDTFDFLSKKHPLINSNNFHEFKVFMQRNNLDHTIETIVDLLSNLLHDDPFDHREMVTWFTRLRDFIRLMIGQSRSTYLDLLNRNRLDLLSRRFRELSARYNDWLEESHIKNDELANSFENLRINLNNIITQYDSWFHSGNSISTTTVCFSIGIVTIVCVALWSFNFSFRGIIGEFKNFLSDLAKTVLDKDTFQLNIKHKHFIKFESSNSLYLFIELAKRAWNQHYLLRFLWLIARFPFFFSPWFRK